MLLGFLAIRMSTARHLNHLTSQALPESISTLTAEQKEGQSKVAFSNLSLTRFLDALTFLKKLLAIKVAPATVVDDMPRPHCREWVGTSARMQRTGSLAGSKRFQRVEIGNGRFERRLDLPLPIRNRFADDTGS